MRRINVTERYAKKIRNQVPLHSLKEAELFTRFRPPKVLWIRFNFCLILILWISISLIFRDCVKMQKLESCVFILFLYISVFHRKANLIRPRFQFEVDFYQSFCRILFDVIEGRIFRGYMSVVVSNSRI